MNGNKTTATSSEERRMQRGISVLAFFVPAFIMLVLFIIRGIYPFGDRSFLFSDMYHQYMPFLSEFVHKIKAGEGLFYSYNVGIGSNFLALYVYYLASPFNWLVFLSFFLAFNLTYFCFIVFQLLYVYLKYKCMYDKNVCNILFKTRIL